MIRIHSSQKTSQQEFTSAEIEEVIPIWRKLTEEASRRSLRVAAYYGEVNRQDPEWTFLTNDLEQVIQDWAADIRRLGGEPRELWTIAWVQEGRRRTWQLDFEGKA